MSEVPACVRDESMHASTWLALSCVDVFACVKLRARLSARVYLCVRLCVCVCFFLGANHLHYKCVSLQ